MRLSCYWSWISSSHCQSSLRIHSAIASWIHSYFDNMMTKFMINNRTDAWKTDVNLLNIQFSRARSCWCDSARAQGLQKQTCRWYSGHFLCSMPALSLLFFFIIERSVLMAFVFYNKGMLEKVAMQRTQQFSDFSISKEPSQMQRMRSCSKHWDRLLLQKLADLKRFSR